MSYFDTLQNQKEIVFVAMMELGWEIQRWAAAVNHFIKTHPDKRYIIATLADRLDLYKGYHDHYPIHIDGLYVRKRPDMYVIHHMDAGEKKKILDAIHARFPTAHICEPPDHDYTRYLFSYDEMDFDFQPRPFNKKIIDSLYKSPAITVAPRHRSDCNNKRNWRAEYWHELYLLLKDYTVFIAGSGGGYIRPARNLQHCICLEDHVYVPEVSSTIGLVIEGMRVSKATVGQQSGNPLLSLQLGVPVVSWGHEKHRHTVMENPKGTKCFFFDDPTYSITPQEVYKQIETI